MSGKKYTIDLPIPLTREQVLEKASALSASLVMISELEAQKRDATRHYREQIVREEAEVSRLSHEIREGSATGKVTVEEILDLDRSVISVVRVDTGEEISTRPISPQDRQGRMFDEDEQ